MKFPFAIVVTITAMMGQFQVTTSHDSKQPTTDMVLNASPGAKSSVLHTIQNRNNYMHDLHTSNFKYRRKRQIPADLHFFKPIRITVIYSDTRQLNSSELQRLKQIVGTVVNTTQQILSVYPVVGALKLPRNYSAACPVTMYRTGVNSGKCKSIARGYKHEFCFQKIDGYQIPQSHFEGLYIYSNKTSPHGEKKIDEGAGVNNTDFILYVRAITTRTCLIKTNVLAYSIYCKADSNKRPIAGYINFCPDSLKRSIFSDDHITKTTQHEIFHTLGFTRFLFKHFKTCTASASELKCYNQYKPIQYWQGITRLATPNVLSVMREHFKCTVDAFGAPLIASRGVVTSHWDARFLQGSIMTPTIDKPHLVSVDKVTLAAFKDMGWYRVNNSLERPMLWGKGGGCYFGLDSTCSASGENDVSGSLCNHRGELGCHYLHVDKAICHSPTGFGQCQMFVALDNGACFKPRTPENPLQQESYGETFSPGSRCFVSNLTIVNGAMDSIEKPEGRCYEHRCNETNLLEIKIGQSEWAICPFNKVITIEGYYGTIRCPRKGVLCFKADPKPTTTAATTSQSPSSPHTTTHHSFIAPTSRPSISAALIICQSSLQTLSFILLCSLLK